MTTIDSDIHSRLARLEADAAKGRLLAEYAELEPREFIEYQAFGPEADRPVFRIQTVELMWDIPCRVLIDPETSSADAVAMLRRVADSIERNGLRWEFLGR